MNEISVKEEVVVAAQWLAEQKEPPRLAVPTLKKLYGLTALQACDAIRLAQSFRAERGAIS